GSPDRNKPLQVVHQGASGPVALAVGGRASTQLTFTPVLGEAGGYCASGAAPFAAPSIVVGVAGAGRQLAPDDGGDFALCGTSVRATAFRATGA
ncbi:Tat pathway signal sequence domain protein, partial [Streptomyces sp. Ru72]